MSDKPVAAVIANELHTSTDIDPTRSVEVKVNIGDVNVGDHSNHCNEMWESMIIRNLDF